jgi:hypothetical protein
MEQIIERTFDYRLVNKIAGKVPVISSKMIYLVYEKEMVWAFEEYLDGLMIHVSVLKSARGKKAVEVSKMAFKWLHDNGFKNVYACISQNLKDVCHFAIAIGMKFTHKESREMGNIEHKFRCYKIILGA